MNAAMSVWVAFAWTLASIPLAVALTAVNVGLVRRWERREILRRVEAKTETFLLTRPILGQATGEAGPRCGYG